MNSLLKQYNNKQKKTVEDQKNKERTDELLDEFKLQYGFNISANSRQFRAFKLMKSDEVKQLKAKQKKEEKKASSLKHLKEVLEKEVQTTKSEN